MSQQPPPPPYGGPPGQPPYEPPPYGGPPGEPPPRGRSNKARFWIGVLLALPALIVAGVISGAGSAVVDGVGGDPSVGAAVSGVIALALLVGFVLLIVFERTRWIALGMLAGTAILFVVVAGACVALLVGYSNNYG